MESEYRGYTVVPPIAEEEGGWLINDPNVGVVRSHTYELAEELWRLRVDFLITRGWLEEEKYDRLSDGFACRRCGNLVVNVFAHEDFFHST